MQNSGYADALAQGRAAAARHSRTLDAVLAVVRPVVECNRTQVDNGRTYLREMVFGDPRSLTTATPSPSRCRPKKPSRNSCNESQTRTAEIAATRAHIVSAIMFLTMAAGPNNLRDRRRDHARHPHSSAHVIH